MKTFMKFTLAVFVMLLVGTQASQAWVNPISEAETNAGCQRLFASNESNIKAYITGPLDQRLTNHAMATRYSTQNWGPLEKLLDIGCQWCAKRPRFGGFMTRCNAYARELDQYIGFKMGEVDLEYGTLSPKGKKCKERVPCSQDDVDASGECMKIYNALTKDADAGFKDTFDAQGCWHRITEQGFQVCKSTAATRPAYSCRVNFLTTRDVVGKYTNEAGRTTEKVYKRGGKAYGYKDIEIIGMGVPAKFRDALGDRFDTLDQASKCYYRGCSKRSFPPQVSEARAKSLGAEEAKLQAAHQEVTQAWAYQVPVAAVSNLAKTPARMTVDTKPAPVNQSKGFDGYQTALIVGLCVASAFITAGSIYACRRLNEKAIELPVDVEGQNVSL